VCDTVDGRSGLHPQRGKALAPANLVMVLFIAIGEMFFAIGEMRRWRRVLLLLLLMLLLIMLLLVPFSWRLICRGTGRFVEGIWRRRRKDGIRRVVGGNGVVGGLLRLLGLRVVSLVLGWLLLAMLL
jgi:hypothetical protein